MKYWRAMMAVLTASILSAGAARAGESLILRDHWRLQSEKAIPAADGAALSALGYDDTKWYPTTVPMTVLAALVQNGVYPDPYHGTNITRIPGYVEGKWLQMPSDSPFYPSWWYRTEFEVPASFAGQVVTLDLEGINYQANVWLNGQKIAGADQLIGMFRRFELPVAGVLKPGEKNCLALELIAPGKLPRKRYATKQVEATTGWDDHNPQPPDLNVGIWRDVWFRATGPARVDYPYVMTDLDLPALDHARLTLEAMVSNPTDQPVTAELRAAFEGVSLRQTVELKPGETRAVRFTPDRHPELNLKNPRLWWPVNLGSPELYDLRLEVLVDGKLSDDNASKFGVREATTYIDDEGWRGYMINGRKVLIRGGAWMTADMLLRLSEKRYEALVRYAKEGNLNMLRSEGFSIRETDEFYNLCDRYGVMVTQQIFGRSIPDEQLAVACVRDMLLRIRKHPSLVHFLGHDETFPTDTLDAAYRRMIAELVPDRTYQPHSGAFLVKDRFETGGTRTGTLELWTYAGPAQYYLHDDDGAWGFAQSGGIGGVVASMESIRRMIPADELWPLWSPSWSLHTVIQGGGYFDDLVKKVAKRYGKADNVEEFVMTVQASNYEGARAMYEAYGRNKYDALGITTWKYDAAWPAALTWAYIDWYLLPTAAYYGAKKACEPLHVQYSYDDDSVWVVNTFGRDFTGLTASARVFDLNWAERWKKDATVSVGPDGKTLAFKAEFPGGLSKSFFLKVELRDAGGRLVTDNFYWLSTRRERPGELFYGVVKLSPSSLADHTALRALPRVKLDVSCGPAPAEGERALTVTLKNPGSSLAFLAQAAVTKGPGGMEVAPSYWSDNFVSLLPGEEKTLTVKYAEPDLEGKAPVVRINGWNLEPVECAP